MPLSSSPKTGRGEVLAPAGEVLAPASEVLARRLPPPAGGELEEGWELEKESRETWKSHKMICLRKLKRKHKKECIADRDSITGRKYQTLDTEVPDPAF